MYKYGFIGFGSMANMLINCFIKYANISVSEIVVTRKDKSKLNEIAETFAGIKTYENSADVVRNAKYIFICIKPAEFRNVLEEIRQSVSDNNHLVSLAGSVKLSNIEKMINGKISKLIPSFTSEIGEGISLICHNRNVTETDIALLESVIGKFSSIKKIKEEYIGFATELTSCMPGFVASIFCNISKAANNRSNPFTQTEIDNMITTTLYATAKMIYEKNMSFEQIIKRVATKGGITIEGVNVFNERLPEIFDEMFNKTLKKRALIEAEMDGEWEYEKNV